MITIVEYGVGNLGSIVNMLKRIGVPARVSGDPETIRNAEKLILPGVGHFDTCSRNLSEHGLVAPLTEAVMERRTPLLGVCVGMQLFGRSSEEGELPGLGWFDADVVRVRPQGEWSHLRVPHMGWNKLDAKREHPLLGGMDARARFYFVHSYHLRCDNPDDVVATTDYGAELTAIVSKGNIWGTQFHPEKSHRYGMQLLSNFAQLAPVAT